MASIEELIDRPDPSDSTHCTMKLKSWWEDILDELNLKRDYDLEYKLNNHKFSKEMQWSNRFFVIKKY